MVMSQGSSFGRWPVWSLVDWSAAPSIRGAFSSRGLAHILTLLLATQRPLLFCSLHHGSQHSWEKLQGGHLAGWSSARDTIPPVVAQVSQAIVPNCWKTNDLAPHCCMCQSTPSAPGQLGSWAALWAFVHLCGFPSDRCVHPTTIRSLPALWFAGAGPWHDRGGAPRDVPRTRLGRLHSDD